VSANSLRIVFAGTPEFAARHLAALNSSQHRLVAVYTQPDRPAGRGKKLQASPVKQLAQAAAIPVFQPASLRNEDARLALAALQPDVMVVVAYGLILPQAVLDIPRLGCLNVHASLLPRWRGAAPIQRAIEAGDRETGVTIMQMDAGLDTGAMLAVSRCPIDAASTAASLHDRLAALGAPLLLQVLDELESYQRAARAQDDHLATYADKIRKEEALVDWQADAAVLARRVAAFNPFPVCYSLLNGERVRLWGASAQPLPGQVAAPGTILRADSHGLLVACGNGALLLQRLQLPGGRAMAVADLLNSRAELLAAGERFTNPPAGQH
jgi:methionyl-tRNA formyltransferase